MKSQWGKICGPVVELKAYPETYDELGALDTAFGDLVDQETGSRSGFKVVTLVANREDRRESLIEGTAAERRC